MIPDERLFHSSITLVEISRGTVSPTLGIGATNLQSLPLVAERTPTLLFSDSKDSRIHPVTHRHRRWIPSPNLGHTFSGLEEYTRVPECLLKPTNNHTNERSMRGASRTQVAIKAFRILPAQELKKFKEVSTWSPFVVGLRTKFPDSVEAGTDVEEDNP